MTKPTPDSAADHHLIDRHPEFLEQQPNQILHDIYSMLPLRNNYANVEQPGVGRPISFLRHFPVAH
ncbi:hypothetical protein LXM94_19120 [Rhizobium sp. TRM95111]|uniref:hypothetical protein n=1 Tax=Rhizobium alarense TaxID=2846851 RepID=UPI001F27B3EA|nr:hypothetical protein [Rhizobium alarense]MCF3642083.1 hypothetical protein [Rhizobium alarense]